MQRLKDDLVGNVRLLRLAADGYETAWIATSMAGALTVSSTLLESTEGRTPALMETTLTLHRPCQRNQLLRHVLEHGSAKRRRMPTSLFVMLKRDLPRIPHAEMFVADRDGVAIWR